MSNELASHQPDMALSSVEFARREVVVGASLACFAVTAYFAVATAAEVGVRSASFAGVATCSVAAALALELLRRRRPTVESAAILLAGGIVAVFLVSVANGGTRASGLLWNIPLPLLAGYLFSPRVGFWLAGALSVEVGALYAWEEVVGPLPREFPLESRQRLFTHSIIAILAFTSAIPWLHQWRSAALFNRLELALQEGKRTSEALEKARIEAQEATRARTDFFASLTHELRTPLVGIIGVADLLRDAELPPDALKLSQHIRLSGRNLLYLVDDILELAQRRRGELLLENRPFCLGAAIERVVADLGVEAEAKGIALYVQCGPEVPPSLLGDSARVEQILSNLLSNAIKFTERGFVRLTAEVAADRGNVVDILIVVADSGVGIAPGMQHRLFEPFTQLDGSASRRHGGAGLGLAVCRELVVAMVGTMDLQSEVGVGSQFRVQIPFARSAESPEAPPPRRRSYPSLAAAKVEDAAKVVLVAEDNPVNQLLLVKLLRHLGFEVDVAGTGPEAVIRAAEREYCAILMDCQLPELDGYDAAAQIRAGEQGARRVPIVAVTAHTLDGDRERCLGAGMDDYLTKPVSLADLRRVLPSARGEQTRNKQS